jgi:hypothetical protein
MSTLTGLDFYNRYGHPKKKKNLVIWDVPENLEIGFIPKKIYCNADLIPLLTQAFKNLIDRGCVKELKTWDGCWNFRPIRGYEKKYQTLMDQEKEQEAIKYLSIHSWGGAVDLNASENGLGQKPKLSAKFVKCFTDAGFEWGGSWSRPDGMHFQMKILH